MAASLTLLALAVTLVSARTPPRARIVVGVAGCWAIALMFWMASHVAVAAVRRSPLLLGAAIRDVVVTPMPANPLCATALVIEIEGDDYIIKRAMVAAVPVWMTASRCPTAADGEPTAPLTPIAASPEREVLWKDEFRAPLHELLELARDNCHAAAFLKFARAPYWMRRGPDELIVGDLRFDRRRGLDFSDLRIAVKPALCPSAVPSWLPPRDDLLRPP
jgi:inner membrane protein